MLPSNYMYRLFNNTYALPICIYLPTKCLPINYVPSTNPLCTYVYTTSIHTYIITKCLPTYLPITYLLTKYIHLTYLPIMYISTYLIIKYLPTYLLCNYLPTYLLYYKTYPLSTMHFHLIWNEWVEMSALELKQRGPKLLDRLKCEFEVKTTKELKVRHASWLATLCE
jgi:hypothetical protein